MNSSPEIRQRDITTEDRLPETLNPVLRRVLLARGVSRAEQLDLGLQGLAHPASLSGLDKAAALLATAIQEGRRICIVGDFDADGATGTAVAMRGLHALGARRVDFRVPNRFEFGYGLTRGLVGTLAESPPDLVVTVDSGISCLDGTAAARDLGCDVLITDHHLPGERLPEATAIVNPNLPGDAFPSKALAGVGVMFYLLSAVRQVLSDSDWFSVRRPMPRLDSLLDLVALGTVADLVPLDFNNRVLVRQGMDRIRAGRACEGVMALLRVAGRDYRHLVASDLGFAVAPRLNAAGRLEDMSVGIRCLLSDDVDQALELAGRLDRLNRERQAVQAQMQREALEAIEALPDVEHSDGQRWSLCLHDPGWHQGVVGLVASRIKERVHRPVVAFAPEEPGSERLKGSARSIRGLHIRDVLAHVHATHPGLIDAFGGHAMAAGLTLKAQALEPFAEAFEDAVRTILGDELPSADVKTDGSLSPAEFTLDFARELRELGPWGQRFPEPLFDGLFEVLDQRVVGGAHLKMRVRPEGARDSLDAIAFGRLPEDLPGTQSVRLLYRLDVNHFRGESRCQLIVERIVA
ncbi:MAG: single-stranded-DNA-specific exonuclease RecJ [Xanthomonadales bacterium]|nr:single-stranded-DNA-specific exonuclease RecJ [Xanthomonadales bacterium]